MAKLEKLTAKQEALLPIVRDEWIRRALGGDTSLDRDAARKSVDWLYRQANLDPPTMLVIVDSPLGAQLAANALKRMGNQGLGDSVRESVEASVRKSVGASVRKSVWDSVGDSVWDSVGESVWDSVRESVGASVRKSVGASVWDSVWDSVRESVEASVRKSVGASVRKSVWDSVGDSVWDSVRESVESENLEWFQWGYYAGLGDDAHWTAWADFWIRTGIIQPPTAWPGWLKYMKLGVWDAIWLKTVAILVRRPKIVRKNGRVPEGTQPWRWCGDLHNMTGPAVEWGDGYANYFLHGMRVQAEWIEHPERITVQQVLEEKNVELRRALVTLMGMERFVREGEFKVVDQDHDASNMPRRLLRKEMPEDEPLVLVEVQCPSTGKIAHLRVPPTCVRCSEAVAWTFGFEAPETYRPAVEA